MMHGQKKNQVRHFNLLLMVLWIR